MGKLLPRFWCNLEFHPFEVGEIPQKVKGSEECTSGY